MPDQRQTARDALIAGLRDAHALERQAVAVMEMQQRSLRDYPDFEARVAEHVRESKVHAERLESALRGLGAGPSMLKDMALAAMGLGQSTVQMFAEDAAVKALLADTMFEHLEIAAYRALLEMADLAGEPGLRPDLEANLREEEAMADWLEANLAAITRRYVMRAGGGASPEGDTAHDTGATTASAPAAASETGAAPEAPLRALAEFTDAEPERAEWPDGSERPQDLAPAADHGTEAAPGRPRRALAEFTDAEPDRADWPDGSERPDEGPKAV